MTVRAIHWHEGMFLRPQHFQTAFRNVEALAHRNSTWDCYFNWGLIAIELDPDALANYRLQIRSLSARLRDGTMVQVPDDGDLPTLDLKPIFARATSVTAFLAIPTLNLGRANVADSTGSDTARFLVDSQQLEDENTGINPQPIRVRLLNLKLLFSTQDTTGHEVLPIARIEKSPSAEATPQVDLTYIPPLLACDAWSPLQAGILQAITDRVGKKIELLANQVVTRGISFDSQSQGDSLVLAQLSKLNEISAVLSFLTSVPRLHPMIVYLELIRIVGQLSIFGPDRRPHDLARYDHDDLGTCFYRCKQQIDALLSVFIEPEYKERPFIGAGLRMQVTLEPAWMEPTWQMYIGVTSPLETEECIRLLTRAGELDMKIGSSDRVDSIFRMGQAGMRFTHAPRPPRALPSMPGLIYFQISREAQEAEWQSVQKSLTLAVRLNEKIIAGNIQGQRVLTIKTGGQTTTLQFSLYVVPQGAR